MDAIVQWFTVTLEPFVSKEAAVFIISLFPILELRGGLLAARLLQVPYIQALALCVAGNILPIPFIFIRLSLFQSYKDNTSSVPFTQSNLCARLKTLSPSTPVLNRTANSSASVKACTPKRSHFS